MEVKTFFFFFLEITMILRQNQTLASPRKLSAYATGLKCLEFSNPIDCNYVKQDNQITVILGLNGENLWLVKSEDISFFLEIT